MAPHTLGNPQNRTELWLLGSKHSLAFGQRVLPLFVAEEPHHYGERRTVCKP